MSPRPDAGAVTASAAGSRTIRGMSDDSPMRGEPSGELPALRASDAEREQTAETLRQAMGEGRLTSILGMS